MQINGKSNSCIRIYDVFMYILKEAQFGHSQRDKRRFVSFACSFFFCVCVCVYRYEYRHFIREKVLLLYYISSSFRHFTGVLLRRPADEMNKKRNKREEKAN